MTRVSASLATLLFVGIITMSIVFASSSSDAYANPIGILYDGCPPGICENVELVNQVSNARAQPTHSNTQAIGAANPSFDCTTVSEIPQLECEALVALYNSTDGNNWANNDGWLITNTPCSWTGVTCSNEHVTKLILHSNQLVGSIPSELGNLSDLQEIYLYHNSLSGNIPEGLGKLKKLRVMIAYANQLDGSMPAALGDLSSLEDLKLDRNDLENAIPASLGNLVNLKQLFLYSNRLSDDIPSSFTNLDALTKFWFFDTSLCEPVDAGFQAWLAGVEDVRGNGASCGGFSCSQVNGIPHSECEVLVDFYKSTGGSSWIDDSGWLTSNTPCLWNGLSCRDGHISSINLGKIGGSGNGLTGKLPDSLADLTELEYLYLNNNQLTGLTATLGQLDNLRGLWINNNLLSGSIPSSFGEIDSLEQLSLQGNELTGNIPPEFGNLLYLQQLYLNNNALEGNIPQELGQLTTLRELALFTNRLSGNIPDSLCELTRLTYFEVGHNQLNGTIPDCFGQLSNVQVLGLEHNSLAGELPTELKSLSRLKQLHVDSNLLWGELPEEIRDLVNLESLRLDGNAFTGVIPRDYTSLTSLKRFYFDRTELCEPATRDFQDWLEAIADYKSTEYLCWQDDFDDGVIDKDQWEIVCDTGNVEEQEGQVFFSLPVNNNVEESEQCQLHPVVQSDEMGRVKLTATLNEGAGPNGGIGLFAYCGDDWLTFMMSEESVDFHRKAMSRTPIEPDLGPPPVTRTLTALWTGAEVRMIVEDPQNLGQQKEGSLDCSEHPLTFAFGVSTNPIGSIAGSIDNLFAWAGEFVTSVPPTTLPTPTFTFTPTATTTPSPTDTPTTTHTPTSTPTTTHTPTSTATPTPTATTMPTPTGSPSPAPDAYESDNICQDSNGIEINGPAQTHNFHNEDDVDWLRLQAVADTRYVISARHLGDRADPEIALFDVCDSADPIAETKDFGPDTSIVWQAPNSGTFYLSLNNTPESVFVHDTEYQVSIRTVTTGVAIIASGRLYTNEELQPQINFMSERAYRVFNDAGYGHDDIYFLSADKTVFPPVDGPSTAATLQFAITTWAEGRLSDGAPLFIYLTDHGEGEQFYLDTGNNIVTTEQLDQWLLVFQKQHPTSPVVIIIEACFSGSFITPAHSLSRQGRMIITSTGDNNKSYAKSEGEGGAEFSDPFFNALAQNNDLWTSYRLASQAVYNSSARYNQTPWFDADGDGVPYPMDVDEEWVAWPLGLGRASGGEGSNHPYLERPVAPAPSESSPTHIAIKALDESLSTLYVWMEVTTPNTPPPSAPPGYITPISHAQRIDLTYNPTTDRFEVDFTFDEPGRYQFIFQAEDAGGQRSQPVVVEVQNGGMVYLPTLLREDHAIDK